MTDNDDKYNIRVYAWSLDFLRAFLERPKIIRWLIYWLMGKYARIELFGLMSALERSGAVVDFPYTAWSLGPKDKNIKWR